MECNECGAQLEKDKGFCGFCGASVEVSMEVSSGFCDEAGEHVDKECKKRLIIIGSIVATVIICLLGIFIFWGNGDKENPLEEKLIIQDNDREGKYYEILINNKQVIELEYESDNYYNDYYIYIYHKISVFIWFPHMFFKFNSFFFIAKICAFVYQRFNHIVIY